MMSNAMLQHCCTGGQTEEMTKDALVPAYTWTFEPVVSSREGPPMVVEMLQHSGAQNRQKYRKDKAGRYFAAHMACPAEMSPIKEKEEKVKRGTTNLELQARFLLHLERDSKLESMATYFGISLLLFPCYFLDGV
ncbi:hypothetical protein GQ457_16G017960 [Hibiscus cannabinus]